MADDLDTAYGHLHAVLVQASPRDDQIIIEHVRDAYAAIERCRHERARVTLYQQDGDDMTRFGRCPICREYDALDSVLMPHRCKPEWECRMEWDDDSDWAPIRASDPESAAERFVAQYDSYSGDYKIAYGNCRDDPVVLVRKPPEPDSDDPPPAATRWEARGEIVPSYSVRQLADDPIPSGHTAGTT